MMPIGEWVEDGASFINVADTPEGLSRIQDPDCAVAIWNRRPLERFQSWLDGLAQDQLPKARVILRPKDVGDAVGQICELSGTPDRPERGRLVDDVTALADILAGLTKAPFLRLRFDIVTTNACRRFHTDAVTLRLVCTYRGTGTQYGVIDGGSEPNSISTVPTGSPILLRGTLWPPQTQCDIRHRSPPIEGTGEIRLVLVLDPISGPEEAYRDGGTLSIGAAV